MDGYLVNTDSFVKLEINGRQKHFKHAILETILETILEIWVQVYSLCSTLQNYDFLW